MILIFIYKITNIQNGKIYIGQSIRPIEQRFKRHINDAINNKLDTHFARAIRKYGENSFVVELIDTAKSQSELTKKECYWINYYDSVNCGYNETDASFKCGGNTYGSKNFDELALIRKKLSISKMGENNPNSRKIKCFNIETGEELFFDTIEDCTRHFGETNHQFIVRRCSETRRILYKKKWIIAYAENNYPKIVSEEPLAMTRRNIKIVDLISENETYFNTYAEAEKYYGLKKGSFSGKTYFRGEKFIVDNKYEITILN